LACELLGNYGGEEVGWRHGIGSDFSEDASVIYTTAAYEWRRLLSKGAPPRSGLATDREDPIYILDEFHEYTAETTLLLELLLERPNVKIVITSATLDATALARRLGAKSYGLSVESINVPAPHRFPVQHVEPQGTLAESVAFQQNSLVFVYGHRPMLELAEEIRTINPKANIILLSAELSEAEKVEAFSRWETTGGIIIATPVVESSVTIPNVAHVHSTPWAREERLGKDGDKYLPIVEITREQQAQREGRTGRTGPGCVTMHGVRAEALRSGATPKIATQPLLTPFYDITASGRDAERFLSGAMYSPPQSHVEFAVHSLQTLGVLSQQRNLTSFGNSLRDLRGDIRTRIMLRRAEDLSVQDAVPPELLLEQAIDAAVILEVEGIFSRRSPLNEFLGRGIVYDGWKDLAGIRPDTGSDVVTQMRVLQSLLQHYITGRECASWGVDPKRLDEARAMRAKLRVASGLSKTAPSRELGDSQAARLKECIIAGFMDTISFQAQNKFGAQNPLAYRPLASMGPGHIRHLAKESGVESASFVVGKWISLDNAPEDFGEPSRILTLATKVPARLLAEWVSNSSTAPREVRDRCHNALRDNRAIAQERARRARPEGPPEQTVRRRASDRGRNRR
jgi:HrpA-like RNA helicase